MVLARVVVLVWVSCIAATVADLTQAQNYPVKPVRIVTGGAGAASDFTARRIAEAISPPLGQPVIVDNRGGGLIPAEVVSKSPADGYTLLVGGGFWRLPLLRGTPYDMLRDVTPISQVTREVFVVAVHPSIPSKSVKEFIALAKARPGQINFSTGTAGSTGHLATELLKNMAGINIVWIPHKGSVPAVTSLLSGDVQMITLDPGLLMPHAKGGKLRALAVTSLEPSSLAPGLPTVSASGLPGYEWIGMTGLFAPTKTAASVINRINQETVRYLRTAEARDAFFTIGAEPVGNAPEAFATALTSDIAKVGKLVKDSGIKID